MIHAILTMSSDPLRLPGTAPPDTPIFRFESSSWLTASNSEVTIKNIRSGKGAVSTTKQAGNSFAPRSVLRESLKSAKGAARTTRQARNCFAPRSVLRESLKG